MTSKQAKTAKKITFDQVSLFEKLVSQLRSTHREISALSKKSPNDAVNIFKISLINATLAPFNALIGEQYWPFKDFATFSVDDVPSNSDVSFVISQYLECAEKFRIDHVVEIDFSWFWDTAGNQDRIETLPPTRHPSG